MADDVSYDRLERFRSYLLLMARAQLHPRPRHKVDASDIVQHTLLEAHAKFEQFSGDESALAAWLRRVLANNIRDAVRDGRRKKRDVRREQSLEAGLEQTSLQLANCLAADQTSPSGELLRDEILIRLSEALLTLPEAQREAVTLHHLHGWSLREVAAELDKSDAAAASLLHRGLQKLRELFQNDG